MIAQLRGSYVTGCWISIQQSGIQLIWGEGISLQNRDLSREEVVAIDRLYHRIGEPSDWLCPKENGAAWSDPPAVPWVVVFMELLGLDTTKRYDCFDVAVPAEFLPDCKEVPTVITAAR